MFLLTVVHFRYDNDKRKNYSVWQKAGYSGKMACKCGIQRASFKSSHTKNEKNSEVCPSNRLCHLMALNVIPSNTRRRPKRPETRESEIAPLRSTPPFLKETTGEKRAKTKTTSRTRTGRRAWSRRGRTWSLLHFCLRQNLYLFAVGKWQWCEFPIWKGGVSLSLSPLDPIHWAHVLMWAWKSITHEATAVKLSRQQCHQPSRFTVI